MFSVKVEFDNKSVCRGCLSRNRKTVQLKNLTELFFTLLGVQQQYCESQIILCWECVALLKRIQSFQNRIQHAQFLLQQCSYELDDLPTSLSNLSTDQKDLYDYTLDHDEVVQRNEEPPEFNINIIKREITDEYDSVTNDNEHFGIDNEDSFSDNEILTIDYEKLKKLETEQPKVKIKREKADKNEITTQSIRRYESKATVTKLNIDDADLKKHRTRTYVTESEIEDVLKREIRSWGTRSLPHKCSKCKNSYKRLVDLRRHETFNHTQQSFPTKCKECSASVSSWKALENHWRHHSVYFKCTLCGWVSYSEASMTRHHHRNHTKIYTCKTCDSTFRTLREFSIHYKERHERIICDHCGKSFVKKHTLEVHIKDLVLAMKKAVDWVHVTEMRMLRWICAVTRMDKIRNEYIRGSLKVNDTLYCHKRHHTPATCQECNKTYAHYHVLENHYRMYHPHLITADTRTELAYCVECDKQFPSVYKYRRHLTTAAKHTPPKPVRVPCPECDKVFARKIRMTNHYNSVHRNTTKHRCDICNKTFCSAFSARTHRQHVHEKIPMPKNKMCDLCGRGFSTNRILANHRRTHTGERPYKCLYCPATFAQRTAMKTHEKTQHKNMNIEHA